jgi:hypothetical protein
LKPILRTTWWYYQDWQYLTEPGDYCSSKYHLTMVNKSNTKCIYLPFFTEGKTIKFYSPFLKYGDRSRLKTTLTK